MTTPTDRDTQPAEAGLFEDLPGPSQAQGLQAQAKAAAKPRNTALAGAELGARLARVAWRWLYLEPIVLV